MQPQHLKNLVVHTDDDAKTALWKTVKSFGGTICVVNEEEQFIGVLTSSDFPSYHPSFENSKVGDFCNRDCHYVTNGADVFLHAKRIFEQIPQILMLPVLDQDGKLIDVIFKFQAFYEDYFRDPARFHLFKPHIQHRDLFPRMYYAYCIWKAAEDAKKLGYDKFSVIEFGVAGGNGLICCEWHAHAISQIFGVGIDIYGFDSGQGLPPATDYRDLPYCFGHGQFSMSSPERLQERLINARLIIGDIRDTCISFFTDHNPAPIGVMLVDVDIYHSTVPILNMLTAQDIHFLPRVQMYFDDIIRHAECTGEALAIKEFNAKIDSIQISPETSSGLYWTGADDFAYNAFLHGTKVCHRFKHPRYSDNPMLDQSVISTKRCYQVRY